MTQQTPSRIKMSDFLLPKSPASESECVGLPARVKDAWGVSNWLDFFKRITSYNVYFLNYSRSNKPSSHSLGLYQTLSLVLSFLLVISAHAEYISQPLLNKILPIIAQAESSNNPNRIGSAGEIGKYQISPILLKDYNSHLKKNFVKSEYLFRPHVNEMVATWFIQERIMSAIEKHNLPVNLARIVYCWNAGISVGINNPIPKQHRVKINGKWRTNRIYDKVYRDYWKGISQ